MPTVGNTAKPATTQEWFGINVDNAMAQLVTMPAGGPWIITSIAAWLAGKDSAPQMYLCLWHANGTLLASAGPFTLTSRAFSLGNSDLYSGAVSVQVSGGQAVYVGFWRAPGGPHQNGRYASGSHLHDTQGASPESLSGWSTDSGGGIGAYVANYVTANVAPSAPALTTSGVQNNGRTVFYSWVHSDPDGNPQNNAQVELRQAGTLIDSWYMDAIGQQYAQSVWRTLPAGYGANAEYTYRVRTADTLLWGPWSGEVAIRPNTPPSTPTPNTVPTGTLTPTITGGVSDPDGNTMSVEVLLVRVSDGSMMWGPGNPGISGVASGGQWSILYAGNALAWATAYRFAARAIDQWGAASAWTGGTYFTPVQPTGPTITPNTTATRQSTVTPTLNLASAAFTNHEIEIKTPSGPIVWSQYAGTAYGAVTSKNVTPGALQWGQEYHWRARVLVGGSWSLWSGYAAFKTNAQPTAPTVSVEDSSTGVPATVNAGGVRVTTDSTPLIRAPFADPDKVPYGDAPGARSFEVRRKDTQAAHESTTAGTTETWTLSTPLLVDIDYQVRVGYRDNMGQPAGTYVYSDWVDLKYSVVPVLAMAAPAGDAVALATSAAADDIIDTATPHGFVVGQPVRFTALTGGAGLSINTVYYVTATSLGASTFRVAATLGGANLGFTTDITAGSVRAEVATVVESTPTLDWTYTGSGAKAQAKYQVRLFDKGPTGANFTDEQIAWDSGEVSSANTSAEPPYGVLLSGHDYRWAVTAWDTDGLSTVLA